MEKQLNFVRPNTTPDDLELFFGPLEDDTFWWIEDHWTMAHLLHAAGIFPSVSQARKNGGDKPIPPGFTILTRGKRARKKEIFIFNEVE